MTPEEIMKKMVYEQVEDLMYIHWLIEGGRPFEAMQPIDYYINKYKDSLTEEHLTKLKQCQQIS